MHGKGKIIYKINSDSYEGSFIYNVISGHGVYKWKNKEVYTGNLVDGKMHGFGIYQWPYGKEYIGEYDNNLKNGQGYYKWKNGSTLKCTYNMGKLGNYGFFKSDNYSLEQKISKKEIKEILKQNQPLEIENSILIYVDDSQETINDISSFINT